MTDPKPLTRDEIAEQKSLGKRCGEEHTLRLIATIERRDEQIEKLRDALEQISNTPSSYFSQARRADAVREVANNALAATEEPTDAV